MNDSTHATNNPDLDLQIAEIRKTLSDFIQGKRGPNRAPEVDHRPSTPTVTAIEPSLLDVNALSQADLAKFIDHTALKPETTEAQIRKLCQEAIEYGFASVCVNATWVLLCSTLLRGSSVKVCTVAGFPLGSTLPEVKMEEAVNAAQLGATEIDMVLNIGRLKSQHYSVVYDDISSLVKSLQPGKITVKVILETALLSDEEKIIACILAQDAGADFVKTATGFNGGGATVADIMLLRKTVGPNMGVKASGGIRTSTDALNMIRAGATRIGASAGVTILQDYAKYLNGQPGDEHNIAKASSNAQSEAY